MVEGQGIVGIELTPETNLARTIIDKYSLSPPVDIQSMVEAYARLSFVHIPFRGVDGVSLNLKARDKSTHVIVNSDGAPSRQRFTMAHELGHILIPWHVGSVLIDQVAPVSSRPSSYFTHESWIMETEANSFAAELLMPYSWIKRAISTTDDLSKIHRNISAILPDIRLVICNSLVAISPRENRLCVRARWSGGVLRYDCRNHCEPIGNER